jgi:hypothetical protein
VAAVDQPLVPEQLKRPDDDDRTEQELDGALMDARNLLYVTLWEDFCKDFKCGLDALVGERGEVFANFRGLVLATDGMRSSSYDKPASASESPAPGKPRPIDYADYIDSGLLGSLGTQPFPAFDGEGAEPNAVMKAFWPFVRRITAGADYRDFIACGVMRYRAIYVTALGSSNQHEENAEYRSGIGDKDETDIEIRLKADGYADTQIKKRVGRDGNNHPVRYLLLTKYDPHPRQVGRILERINAMGTLRLYALKDWSAIKDADPFIRMLGQELDQKIRIWGKKRQTIEAWTKIEEIENAQEQERKRAAEQEQKGADARPLAKKGDEEALTELLNVEISEKFETRIKHYFGLAWAKVRRNSTDFIKQEERRQLSDSKFDVLYELTKEMTKSLIDIGARLDHIGARCIGGLHFRLYRSGHYVKEFGILRESLYVGNIPTWLGYDGFAKRGLDPTFEYISEVGTRLRALRDRLQSVTDTIETSALVVQSEETRKNTAVLRTIMGIVLVLIGFWLAQQTLSTLTSSLSSAGRLLSVAGRWLSSAWHLFGLLIEAIRSVIG